MGLSGMQKTTLLDYPGKVATTVFLSGCDFRCPFCHNGTLVCGGGDALTERELMAHLEKRKGIIDGVVITGGEPTLWNGLEKLIRNIRSMGYAVKLDTNGNHPDVLARIMETGIDYVAMDIKNSLKNYGQTIGLLDFDTKRIETRAATLMSGGVDYEFRTTVVDELHTWNDFMEIAEWLAGAKRYFLQGFVDNGDILGGGHMSAAPKEKMEKYADILKKTIDFVEIRGV